MFNFFIQKPLKMFNKTFLPVSLFGGLTLVFLLFIAACSGSGKKDKGDFSDCPYGAPQAVFPDSLEAVQHQTFELGQGRAIEEVIFRNGKKLELIQSGCTTIRQEYRFPIDIRGAMPQTDEHWLRHAANEMEFLAGLSPSHQPLGAWAQIIAAYATEAKVGESIEVEPGNSFQIDAIQSLEAPMVIVVLSRE
jgi:hypothetical protein